MNVVIIGRDHGCVWCDRAKELLKQNGQQYQFFGVEEYPQLREFARALEISTVPAVFIDGKMIGGYTELASIFDPNHGTVGIILDGAHVTVSNGMLSYEQIVKIASHDPRKVYRVAYSKGNPDQREGVLSPGQSVRVKGGMIIRLDINGNDTGAA